MQARGCHCRQEGKRHFTVNTSTTANITEGSQQQNPILVYLGMSDTPPTNDYCSLAQQNFPWFVGVFLAWFFFFFSPLCLDYFKQIWGKNEMRKIKRPMWKYHESYTYRTRGWSDTHGTWEMTLQRAVCNLWKVMLFDEASIWSTCFRTSLHKTTFNAKSSEGTGLILYLQKGNITQTKIHKQA